MSFTRQNAYKRGNRNCKKWRHRLDFSTRSRVWVCIVCLDIYCFPIKRGYLDSKICSNLTPFLMCKLLAHLSRRLTSELIGYPWIRRQSSSSVVRPFTFSNVFSSETSWPIKAIFFSEPPWEGGTKVCINGPSQMTKMAATPIYTLKTLKNLLLQNRRADFHETWYVASGTPAHHSCINDDPGVTLTYFPARSNLET